jgi:hypothetical protein
MHEQQHFRTLVPDDAVSDAPLPFGFPDRQPIGKAGTHLVAEKQLPFQLADRSFRPAETEVQRRPQLRDGRRAATLVGG